MAVGRDDKLGLELVWPREGHMYDALSTACVLITWETGCNIPQALHVSR